MRITKRIRSERDVDPILGKKNWHAEIYPRRSRGLQTVLVDISNFPRFIRAIKELDNSSIDQFKNNFEA